MKIQNYLIDSPLSSYKETLKIGMFDSGVGGLTVLKEMLLRMPNDSFYYFGDTARFPYGGKSSNTITRYALENSAFLIQHEIDLLVIACNTATAFSLDTVQQNTAIPVIGVITPAVHAACQATRTGKIGVIGTKGTITSGVYQENIKKLLPDSIVKASACPLLVSVIEENFPNKHVVKMIIQEYLEPFRHSGIDTLLLACTHYPLLEEMIREEIPHITIINPAVELANEVAYTYKRSSIFTKESQVKGIQLQPDLHHFFVSDDPKRFSEVSSTFLGCTPHDVITIQPSF